MIELKEYLESMAATAVIREIGGIDDRLIAEVEEECGCSSNEWNIWNPSEVVAASIRVAVRRILRKQGGEK